MAISLFHRYDTYFSIFNRILAVS